MRNLMIISRHDYIRHSLDKQRSYKPEETYVRQGEFDSLTSYNKEYTRKAKNECVRCVNIDFHLSR